MDPPTTTWTTSNPSSTLFVIWCSHLEVLRVQSVAAMIKAFKMLFLARVNAVREVTELPGSSPNYYARDWSVEQRLEEARTHYAIFLDALDKCIDDVRGGEGSIDAFP